ncbi:MAG: efflux RND transporter periplasmic adaptor subunit [Acidobacteriota bacterium]|nr:efflux RND transporter periplasmic adaptor subunit [Acidobacteriota bacterium]
MTRIVRFMVGAIALSVSAAPLAGQDQPAALETTKVEAKALAKLATIPGDLTPYQSVNLTARVSGFVESVAVDRGSFVKRGQRLATIAAPELRAQHAEAEAKLQAVRAQEAEAEAKTVAAQSTYDRLKAASATPGVVSGHDVEMAERSLEAARAHLNALKGSGGAAAAAVKAVAEMASYLQMVSPFDGVITERNVHPGSLVGPSTGALLRIEQVTRLRLTVPVPEAYVGTINKGATVEFRVAAFPDQTFSGVIARPAHTLDVKMRSMLVELDVTNPKQLLAPGMFAEVRWPVGRAGTSLFVPRTAVVRTSERQFVVRVRSGVAEWVDVKRGEASGEAVEVFGDLREGDVVVRRGNDEIRPGARITPAAAKS